MSLRLLLAVVVVLGATACSDEGDTSSQPTHTAPSTDLPDVNLPKGVTLTEVGSTLAVAERATTVYAKGDRVSVLSVTVSDVVRGSMRHFQSFVLSPKERASVPFYVTATVRNEGPQPLPEAVVPLYGFDSTETAFPATPLVGSFERCTAATLTVRFGIDDKVTTCLVYLVPPKATLEAIQLRVVRDAEPISWRVR